MGILLLNVVIIWQRMYECIVVTETKWIVAASFGFTAPNANKKSLYLFFFNDLFYNVEVTIN